MHRAAEALVEAVLTTKYLAGKAIEEEVARELLDRRLTLLNSLEYRAVKELLHRFHQVLVA
ncbi:hypothetical protein SDC9_178438 [bioreactor metagenome]|uniref:Uncharacterized protein n=1 Tax=bioreactor metagenome TaxID=1076179 RepID=A0A645GWB2_9ZZZZ